MIKLMKIIGLVCLCIYLMISGCKKDISRLSKLEITGDNYPRAFFFRSSEHTENYESYKVWEKTYARLMGIEGKCLEEELRAEPFTGSRNREFFSMFKKDHPNQLVLLHFNGNTRDPRFEREKFFAGHWIYYTGARILSDVPEESGTTAIHVSDASLFKVNIGIYKDKNEDIGLCELDAEGKPNWNKSEQVKLISVDSNENIIVVKRGYVNTVPRSFKAGNSYAAAHLSHGPFRQENNLLWNYNFSTLCPRDENGNNCVDILVEELVNKYSEGGELHAFDGIEFDVSYNSLHRYLLPQGRWPDANADTKPDKAVFNGVNTYGLGVLDFYQRLRKGLGDDRLIIADGYEDVHQRAFGIINGIESEGWPDAADIHVEKWSGGFNRFLFWNQNSKPPIMSYINLRWWGQPEIKVNTVRLVIAASCLTSTAIAQKQTPSQILKFKPEVNKAGKVNYQLWDELVMGQANKKGWLGKPMGPTVKMAEKGKELFTANNDSQFKELMDHFKGDVQFLVENEALKITPINTNAQNLSFTLQNIPAYGPDLTILVTARGEGMKNYPDNVARVLYVSVPAQKKVKNRFMSFINQDNFESGFYFSNIPSNTINIEFEIEGNEPVWISEIHIFAHPDVMYREFENGIVLANPSPRPYEFNLFRLFPGQKFRRIKGSPKQDPETNNGYLVKADKIKLQGKDALFLSKVKEK